MLSFYKDILLRLKWQVKMVEGKWLHAARPMAQKTRFSWQKGRIAIKKIFLFDFSIFKYTFKSGFL